MGIQYHNGFVHRKYMGSNVNHNHQLTVNTTDKYAVLHTSIARRKIEDLTFRKKLGTHVADLDGMLLVRKRQCTIFILDHFVRS